MQIYFIHIFVIIYEVKDIYIIKNNLNKKNLNFKIIFLILTLILNTNINFIFLYFNYMKNLQ